MRLEPLNRQSTGTASGPSLAAPTGGLDEASSVTETKPNNALRLVNMIAQKDGLHVRKGTRLWGNVGGEVESWLTWGGTKQFACTQGAIVQVERNVITPQLAGFKTGRWLGDTLANTGGNLLVAGNGFDGLHWYNGTSWRKSVVTSDAQPQLRPERLSNPVWHQNRIFAYERGTLTVWYLKPNAAGGEARPIYVGPRCQKNGEIVAIGSLKPSNAVSTDNKLVVYTSNGEIIVYAGTDPEVGIKHEGTWQSFLPLGWRPFGEVGGQLAMLTGFGCFAIPDVLAKPESRAEVTALTEPIYKTYGVYANYERHANWQILETQAERGLVIMNLPDGDQMGSSFGSWTKLQGMKATAWCDNLNGVFFGDAQGNVRQYGAGSDDDPTGAPIYALCVSGYSKLGSSRLKIATRARPNLKSVPTNYRLSILADYEEPAESYSAPDASSPGMSWDFPMDGTGPWNTPKEATRWDWRSVSGRGHTFASVFAVKTRAPLVYRGCDLMISNGGQT